MNNIEAKTSYQLYMGGFLAGAVILSGFSFVQKILIKIDPFLLKAYFVPVVLGGLAGTALFHSFTQIKRLNASLAGRLQELESILPICAHCKRIKNTDPADVMDQSAWLSVEKYIARLTGANLTHGICPECYSELIEHMRK